MTSPLLRFVRVGGQVSVQDLGRKQAMHTGYTQGGAMDLTAYLWANRLLERQYHAPVFEITLGNVEIECLQACQIALTGADLGATLNGRAIKPWRSYALQRSDVLRFAFPVNGLRAYLAVNAELDLPMIFSSAATVPREQAQNLGESIAIEDGVEINALQVSSIGLIHAVPARFVPDYSAALSLELIPSYQFDQFSKCAIDELLNHTYTVSAKSNRMAYTLQGPAVNHDIHTLASEGIAYGAVQIPPDGQPVVLLNDRQTMGGYPKVGCVSRLSGSMLAQRMNPAEVTFTLVEQAAATQRLKQRLGFFAY